MNETLKSELENSHGRKIFADFLAQKFDNPDELLKTFDGLTEIYLDVLSVTNISALKTADDIYIKHYLDCIYPYDRFSGDCCDVGCGGGFPCLPLAIVTGLKFTGVDSVGKKLLLLHRCVSELHITNIKGDYARSEDLVKLHRLYDTVCARAVGDMDKSLAFCAPLCKAGGKVILYKTQNDIPAKQETLEKYYIKLSDQIDYTLPGTDINRRLYIYTK